MFWVFFRFVYCRLLQSIMELKTDIVLTIAKIESVQMVTRLNVVKAIFVTMALSLLVPFHLFYC